MPITIKDALAAEADALILDGAAAVLAARYGADNGAVVMAQVLTNCAAEIREEG